jgi:hypothetical protein
MEVREPCSPKQKDLPDTILEASEDSSHSEAGSDANMSAQADAQISSLHSAKKQKRLMYVV